ncbi:MAG: sulfite exporter TauE/SafE family protein [Bacteroidota bacterium]
MEYLLAAISLGFLGSFHCVGMCGPIALALPIHQKSVSEKVVSILTYNLGRIVTYALFGILFGFIGQSFALFGYQQKLSILLGSLILLGLLTPKRWASHITFTKKIYALLNRLKNKMAILFQQRSIRSFFSIGLLNGLLPCGLVYMGVAGAIATGTVFKGMLFMAFFGAGTLPLMFSVSYTSHLLSAKTRHLIHKTIPVFTAVMAILLILRGLNLGISYISPKLTVQQHEASVKHTALKCCHKP